MGKIAVFSLALLLSAVFFFWENDESYLEKTTLDLLNRLSLSAPIKNNRALLKRLESVGRHFHFDVNFKFHVNGREWKGRSSGELRSLLAVYFKQGGFSGIRGDALSVQVDSSLEIRTGRVTFKFHGLREKDPVSCEVRLEWIKEKKWFIKTVEVFSCSPVRFWKN